MSGLLLVALHAFIGEAAAAAEGDTLTTEYLGWVSAPNCRRGTLDLLYSCGFTIFLCTWSALHLNVPAEDDSDWTVWVRKLKWMSIAVLIPEYVAVVAVTEWWDARYLRRKMQLFCEGGSKPISMTQSFLPVMGGYALKTRANSLIRLDDYQFLRLVMDRKISIPTYTTDEINDRSKSDWVTKSLACIQVSWLVVQLVGRASQGPAITTLEIFTCSTVICALTAFGFWWSKPLDIRLPFVIVTGHDEDYIRETLRNLVDSPRENAQHIDLNDVRFRKWGENNLGPLVMVTAAAVVSSYKACQLLAWNFDFPSTAEQILWRAVILVSAAITLAWISFFKTHPDQRFDQGRSGRGLNWNSPDKFMFLGYLSCRAYNLIEIFISLRSAPESVYRTVDWDRVLPHL